MIVSIVVSKLDEESRLRFHQSLPDKNMPPLKTLEDFLAKKIIDLTSTKPQEPSNSQAKPKQYVNKRDKPDDRPLSCYICKASNYTFKCPKLISAKDPEKKKLIEASKL
ncbi:unnamed protein product, partial [Allacma fusca]